MAQDPWLSALPTMTFAGKSDACFKSSLGDEGRSAPFHSPLLPVPQSPGIRRHLGTLCLESKEPPAPACVSTPLLAESPTDAQEAADREPLEARSRPFPAHFRKPRVKHPAHRPPGDMSLHPD